MKVYRNADEGWRAAIRQKILHEKGVAPAVLDFMIIDGYPCVITQLAESVSSVVRRDGIQYPYEDRDKIQEIHLEVFGHRQGDVHWGNYGFLETIGGGRGKLVFIDFGDHGYNLSDVGERDGIGMDHDWLREQCEMKEFTLS